MPATHPAESQSVGNERLEMWTVVEPLSVCTVSKKATETVKGCSINHRVPHITHTISNVKL